MKSDFDFDGIDDYEDDETSVDPLKMLLNSEMSGELRLIIFIIINIIKVEVTLHLHSLVLE